MGKLSIAQTHYIAIKRTALFCDVSVSNSRTYSTISKSSLKCEKKKVNLILLCSPDLMSTDSHLGLGCLLEKPDIDLDSKVHQARTWKSHRESLDKKIKFD